MAAVEELVIVNVLGCQPVRDQQRDGRVDHAGRAAQVSRGIRRALAAMPCEFMQFYGATETSGAVTLLRPGEHDLEHEERLKACGRPLPLIELRIVDEHGAEVPGGTRGELLIRSPALASGYWMKPAATAVIGVPDERWGEAVKACVIVVDGRSVTKEALIEYCRERLAGYKIPKSIEFVASFPLTGSGKVAKKTLREPFWREQKRAVA